MFDFALLPPPDQGIFGLIAAGVAYAAPKVVSYVAPKVAKFVSTKAGAQVARVVSNPTVRSVAAGGAGAVVVDQGIQTYRDAFSRQPSPGSSRQVVPLGTGNTIASPRMGNTMAAMYDDYGQALVLPVTYREVANPPRGFVTVVWQGQEVFMRKGCARSLGLWKARPKPPISASQFRTLTKAAMVSRKVDRIKKIADKVTGKSSRRRSCTPATARRKTR